MKFSATSTDESSQHVANLQKSNSIGNLSKNTDIEISEDFHNDDMKNGQFSSDVKHINVSGIDKEYESETIAEIVEKCHTKENVENRNTKDDEITLSEKEDHCQTNNMLKVQSSGFKPEIDEEKQRGEAIWMKDLRDNENDKFEFTVTEASVCVVELQANLTEYEEKKYSHTGLHLHPIYSLFYPICQL